MIVIKKYIYILFLTVCLFARQNTINVNDPIKIKEKQYSALFKQAKSLEKNGLFNEAQLIYENVLSQDPTNKIAFNKIKIILKNNENFPLLKEIAEGYQYSQPNNLMAKIDLLEVYLISSDNKWEKIANDIFSNQLKNDFIVEVLLSKLLQFNQNIFAEIIIESKRKAKDKQGFYSFKMGNYYISRLNYKSAIIEFLIFLDRNPDQYEKVSRKILAMPEYVNLQDQIEKILYDSSVPSAKILLSDIAFKSQNFRYSYDLLKANSANPKQFLDFAYQSKKIKEYDLAIEVYKDIINQDYDSKTTISAILEMGETLEKKSISSKLDMPISKYFYNNQILSSPYYYMEDRNLEILNEAIVLYDSLYSISRGSEAGFRLAEIKFTLLNDLDQSFNIYKDCIRFSKNKSIKFQALLRLIDIMIAKDNLIEAKEMLVENLAIYKSPQQSNILAIKNIQIDFFNVEPSVIDSISQLAGRMSRNDLLYNDLLDIQSILLPFKDNPKLLEKFSKAELLVFQNKDLEAINKLVELYNEVQNNLILKDFIIYQLSYLLLLNQNTDDAIGYLDRISHDTIFSEFSYILKAEIFDLIINDKKSAVDLYLDFINRYPLSIFYDDIRIRLRELAN